MRSSLTSVVTSRCCVAAVKRCLSSSSHLLPMIAVSSTSKPDTDSTVGCQLEQLIGADEIRRRQQSLLKLIDRCEYRKHKSSLLLIPAASRPFQADTKIPQLHFKQSSDFIYFTGFTSHQAADCVLAIVGGHGESAKSYLFTPIHCKEQQLWEGVGLQEQHSSWLNQICDDVLDIDELERFINIHNESKQIFVTKAGAANGNGQLENAQTKLNCRLPKVNFDTKCILPLSSYIDQLRLIKSPQEMDALRRSCQIGAEAMLNAMRWSSEMTATNLINESQVALQFEFAARMRGARKLAFPTVCAAGQRAAAIHYGLNDQFVHPADWIMMDAGCEDVDGYNSDLTRTWPVDRNFGRSSLKNELYEALCFVQKDLIAAVEQNSITLDDLFKMMCLSLGKILMEFKVLEDGLTPREAASRAFVYCPHHVSHYLGLDVHDCPTVSRNIPLKPGMCFTIEPGLYFCQNDTKLKSEFRGIGMRVEDDLLINSLGKVEVLTANCPRLLNLNDDLFITDKDSQ